MSPTASSPLSVVIVEDDLALLAFLVTRLEYEPDLHVVGYACDGAEGLAVCQDQAPDIVLSDFDLPDVDGVALVGALRGMLPAAALVLYTGACTPNLVRQARMAGADDCLDKTLPPGQVVETLRARARARRNADLADAQTGEG
jgi:DNA-binding NarL/FixJ family response regulator